MKLLNRLTTRVLVACFAIGVAALVGGHAAAQTSLLDETRTIGQTNTAAQRDFEITTAGEYELRFTDLAVPAAFASYRVAITRGPDVIVTLDSPATTRRFTATTGSYGARVIAAPGVTATAGTFGVRIVSVASNGAVLDFADAIQSTTAPPPANVKNFDAAFEITTAGNYQLIVTDLQFPAAMNGISAAVIREGAPQLSASLAAPGVAAFSATPGTYRAIASGTASSTRGAGLFSVRVVPAAGGAARFALNVDVGVTQRIGSAVLDPVAHNLTLNDFAVPSPLTSVAAVVVADGAGVANLSAPGTVTLTPAAAALHEVFTVASSAGSSAGAYGVEVRRASTPIIAGARTVAAGSNGVAYAFSGDVTSAGRHSLRLTDFGFPLGFTSLRGALVQGGTSLGSTSAGTTPLEVDLSTGPVTLLVFGQLNAGANGLFGASLVSTVAGARPALELTQGAGSLFDSRRLDITAPGRYEATVADLAFPLSFANLDVHISRGPNTVGTFFSGGSFIFEAATPGNYFVNFIARPAASSGGYGTYRVRVATAQPEPTVTLTAEPASIVTGSTTRLRWSSTNATSCAASGGWSGTKSASGEETTSTLSAAATFTLECTGPGGRKSAQVAVSVNPPTDSGGGGGSLSLSLLLLLGTFVLWRLRYARSTR